MFAGAGGGRRADVVMSGVSVTRDAVVMNGVSVTRDAFQMMALVPEDMVGLPADGEWAAWLTSTQVGGFRGSGLGRQQGVNGLLEFTETKHLNFDSAATLW